MAVLPLCVVPPVLPRVAVVMGSDSDLPTMEPAAAILRELGVEVEVRVLSAHRTPLEMVNFAQAARGQGFGVIVAGAGGAAHLPGMVAALTTLPVIGVPVKAGRFLVRTACFPSCKCQVACRLVPWLSVMLVQKTPVFWRPV